MILNNIRVLKMSVPFLLGPRSRPLLQPRGVNRVRSGKLWELGRRAGNQSHTNPHDEPTQNEHDLSLGSKQQDRHADIVLHADRRRAQE